MGRKENLANAKNVFSEIQISYAQDKILIVKSSLENV